MNQEAGTPVLEARDVHKRYRLGEVEVAALRGVSFRVERGQHVAIVGPSGSGKSTLLNLLGALDRPTSGTIAFEGQDVRTLDEDQLAQLRNRRIGFVFQSFHLLPRVTAVQNVALPLVYRGVPRRERLERAQAALAAVGLQDRFDHRPAELSGGQQQRVAIARALVTHPDVLLADEPTGNLDTVTGSEVVALLERLHAEQGTALIVITHEDSLAARADLRLELLDGQLVGGAVAP